MGDVDNLKTQLKAFVQKTCGHRPPSHGVEHMQEVAELSETIYRGSYDMDLKTLRMILIVAWLHDVNDHKYDKDGTLGHQIREFLHLDLNLPSATIEQILSIIGTISYSKEVKKEQARNLGRGAVNWLLELGVFGGLVRNVVSDADKLTAIGKEGYQRCEEYIKETHPDLEEAEVQKRIEIHAQEKLLLLKDFYIHTPMGKKLAEARHLELIECLAQNPTISTNGDTPSEEKTHEIGTETDE